MAQGSTIVQRIALDGERLGRHFAGIGEPVEYRRDDKGRLFASRRREPGGAFDALARHTRASSLRSAGRKPRWFT